MTADTPACARKTARGSELPEPLSPSRRGALGAVVALATVGAAPAPATAVARPPSAEPDLALVEALRASIDADRQWSAAMCHASDAETRVWRSRQDGAPDAVIAASEVEADRLSEVSEAHEMRWAEAVRFLAATPAAGAIGLAAKILPLREAVDEIRNSLREEEETLLASVLADAEAILADALHGQQPRAWKEKPLADAELLDLAEAAIEAEVRWRLAVHRRGDVDPTAADDEAERQMEAVRDRLVARMERLPARALAGCVAKARVIAACSPHRSGGHIAAYGMMGDMAANLLEDVLRLGGASVETTLRDALRHAEGVPDAHDIFLLPPGAGAGGAA